MLFFHAAQKKASRISFNSIDSIFICVCLFISIFVALDREQIKWTFFGIFWNRYRCMCFSLKIDAVSRQFESNNTPCSVHTCVPIYRVSYCSINQTNLHYFWSHSNIFTNWCLWQNKILQHTKTDILEMTDGKCVVVKLRAICFVKVYLFYGYD